MISIVIPITDPLPPGRLASAVRAALDQPVPAGETLEGIVVDACGAAGDTPGDDARLRRIDGAAAWAAGGEGSLLDTGVAAAQGEWLVFLGGDCQPEDGWLGALWQARQTMGADAVGGSVRLDCACPPPSWCGPFFRRLLGEAAPAPAADYVPYGLGLNRLNLLVRREALERAGGFDPSADDPIGDWLAGDAAAPMLRRLSLKGGIVAWTPAARVTRQLSAEAASWPALEALAQRRAQAHAAACLAGKNGLARWHARLRFGARWGVCVARSLVSRAAPETEMHKTTHWKRLRAAAVLRSAGRKAEK